MIILVCGGRDYSDVEAGFIALDYLNKQHKITGVVQGDARGADAVGKQWAQTRGVTLYSHPAQWDTHGKAAGMIRNKAMLKNDPPPTYLVAFPGGRGTDHMVSEASKAGLVVWRPYGERL